LVPGNHDVNIIDRANPGRFDLPLSPGHWAATARTAIAALFMSISWHLPMTAEFD
jgi:hypothetical protein